MVRTIIKPEMQDISINLPKSYIGRSIEVIAFPVDENQDEFSVTSKTQTHFASEKILEKDWLTPEEDKAWQHLSREMWL